VVSKTAFGLPLIFGIPRKLKIALFGELSLEEAIDLSGDRQIHDVMIVLKFKFNLY
jgi:hypothetical protein